MALKTTSRAERVGEVLAVIWYVMGILSLLAGTIQMTTWVFRLVLAGLLVYVCYRFALFLRADARSWAHGGR